MSFLALAKTLVASKTENPTHVPFAKTAKTTKSAEVADKIRTLGNFSNRNFGATAQSNGTTTPGAIPSYRLERKNSGLLIEGPDAGAFEERAAIAEYNGGLTRGEAEQLAAQCQGYENVVAFKSAMKDRLDKPARKGGADSRQ